MDPNTTISETEQAKDVEYDKKKKKKAFFLAMKGKWEGLIEMYKSDATLHKASLTRAGDTALHIAVSDGKEDVVEKMVDLMMDTMSPEERKQSLQTNNQRKNSALHIAASMGNATMCQMIASADPSLVDNRNVDGETPLFLAALYGRKQAFLCLHYIRNPIKNEPSSPITNEPYYENCRRKNGDTILHCAITSNYFDLAFQIIHLYKDLASSVNEGGLSPLHLLASKPDSFKSGSHLGRTETIIYHCIYVEKLKVEGPQSYPIAIKDSDNLDCPENCSTFRDVFVLMKNVFDFVRGKDKTGEADAKDPEAGVQGKHKNDEVDVKDPEARARGKHKTDEEDAEDPKEGGTRDRREASPLFPANYRTCQDLIKFFYVVFLIILGHGSEVLKKIHRKKENHTWSVQIVKELLLSASTYEYEDDGSNPYDDEGDTTMTTQGDSAIPPVKPSTKKKKECENRLETPILVAAKNGVMEIIEAILELFPVALHDLNEDKKNLVLLAVEHRQPHVYEFLQEKNIFKESVFRQLDKEGNSALHLAAKLGNSKPWLIAGEALQMQWELKWFKFVKEEMPPDFFSLYNMKNETPEDIFNKTHQDLVKSAAEWLHKTSESCSVVAALIATVAFATAATVPGGVNQDSGDPTLENEPAFEVFAISSLVALGFSVTAVVMFLSIMTSRFQDHDFNKDLPRQLLVGFTSLFMSIAAMLVSFCAGHFFVLKDKLRYAALPIYVAACLPVTLFVMAQFPLYLDLIWATFKHVPQRSYRPTYL